MKLTPLNITLACILVWFISEMNADTEMLFSWGWLITLIAVLLLVDVFFRLVIKDLQRIWFLQIGFILVVGIVMVILKIQ
ncbi:hypothetical protein FAZ15_08455 [Sphingobacterium olei]|uniref:Uncharacterized protein n=2 Tax=Sphingobacterium TaxID=28453 RepID=A0A4U0P3N2_9SPHI|nr:hypothetical protein [Sphingobacterium olei]TJZ61222.1 hypothetical protein FAZ15_08455 [Sphingobacterium olei]